MQDYDTIPYESTPIADAHPYKLAALARFLGLTPPEPSTARILELGCAEGGSLIPLARLWPQATLLGLELSSLQVNIGNNTINTLGLKNIRIQQANILEMDETLGQFDYIIVHGVFSWVPVAVQEKILRLCRQLLTTHGLAYISYNVNPGWRLRGALRDMFAFHLRAETSPLRKLELAYAFCDQLERGLGNSSTLMATYLREEISHLRKARRAYVYHEYLEEVNQPLLFSEFVARARQHQLHYLCDTEFYTMFASSFGADAETLLDQFPDILSSEQYADFLRMRTFRQSVLCHAAQTPTYDIDVGVIDQFALYANLTPPLTLHWRTERADNFHTNLGKAIPISQPLCKAILVHLAALYPNAIALPELIRHAQHQLTQLNAAAYAEQLNPLRSELFNLFANGLIGLSTQAHPFPSTQNSLKATRYAHLQAQHPNGFISTLWSETLSLDEFGMRLIELLDGHHSKPQLVSKLYSVMLPNNPHITQEGIERNCDRLLALFAKSGVLEPVLTNC
ncbi:MAG: methyltransferase regulatory domain-containing protein [Gammaproteobacteria bacterium]|nr:methyltransferase regulatory domain-containing protein [Gammaproteobacteria bacterium]